MPYAAEATRTVIREVVEGALAATFKYGAFAGQPIEAQKAMAVQTAIGTHRFDVEIGEEAAHASSPISARDPRKVLRVDVTIPIISHVATPAQEADRALILNAIASDADDAVQALSLPGALNETESAEATWIVSGMMRGPGFSGSPTWRVTAEDWGNQLIRSAISGSIVVDTEA